MKKKLFASKESKLAGYIVLIFIILAFATDGFFSVNNIMDILLTCSYVSLFAAAMMVIMITRNIDVSIGSMLALLCFVAGNMAQKGVPLAVNCVVTVAAAMLLTGLNGLLITRLQVPSMIVTLAMMQIYRGATLMFSGGEWINDLPYDNFGVLGKGKLFGVVPYPILASAAVLLLVGYFMRYTRFSRKVYAVGSNSSAATLAGIHVDRVVFLSFLLEGLLIGIAVMLYQTRFSVVSLQTGFDFEMTVIAATVVGGTATTGGSGTLAGTLLGVLLVKVIGTALTFLQVSSYWEQAIQGVLILAAVLGSGLQFARKNDLKMGMRNEKKC